MILWYETRISGAFFTHATRAVNEMIDATCGVPCDS